MATQAHKDWSTFKESSCYAIDLPRIKKLAVDLALWSATWKELQVLYQAQGPKSSQWELDEEGLPLSKGALSDGDFQGQPEDIELQTLIKSKEETDMETGTTYQIGVGSSSGETTDLSKAQILRMKKILAWLPKSALSKEISTREGFMISRGANVRLADGTVVEVFDWLTEEGFADIHTLDDYEIEYEAHSPTRGDSLLFFKVGVDAPFLPQSRPIAPQKSTSLPEELDF